MGVKYFFDQDTATFTYIVSDDVTKKAAVIDPVLNFDITNGKVFTHSADEVISFVKSNGLTIEWILETHAHADHLTAAQYIKKQLGGRIGIGEHIESVIEFWSPMFNCQQTKSAVLGMFDHLFKDDEHFKIGGVEVKVMHTPGHTPACLTYLIEDMAFVGDTIFMPYVGTARTDFPGGSAKALYHSIQKIFSLEPHTKIYTCHDYPPEGVEPGCLSTVKEQLEKNSMINKNVSEAEFIAARNKKDVGKSVPKLLLPSIQVNMLAGNLPNKESNNISYIKIPLNQL